MRHLLIISDIHLCKEKPQALKGWQRKLPSFLRHHQNDGRRYRLIIAGDLFDFDYQTDNLAQRGPEAASLRLFEEAFQENPGFFEALASFLNAEHEVLILTGNHDLDLSWPGVREALRQALRASGASEEALGQLCFKQWFHHEPGRVYVEHGSQYDPDVSLCGILDPRSADGQAFRVTLGASWITDFCPLIPEMTYAVDHTRGPLYYVPDIAKRYSWRAPILWVRYLAFTWRVLFAAGPEHQAPRPEHRALFDDYATTNGLQPEQAAAIESLAEPPRNGSRWETAARFHMLVAHLLPLSVLLGVLSLLLWSGTFGWAALATLLSAFATSLLVSGRFHGDTPKRLQKVSATIASLVDVPVVVFGHTHKACNEPLPNGGRYINSGTWMSLHQPPTYVQLLAGESPELCTWESD